MGHRLTVGLAAALCGAGVLAGCGVTPTAAVCREPGGAERAGIERAAMGFVRKVTGSEPGDPWAAMTPEGRASVPPDRRAAVLMQFAFPEGYRDFRTTRAYVVERAAAGRSKAAIFCTTGGDTLHTNAPGRQAYALVAAQAGIDERTFTLWLAPAGNGWQVRGFSASTSATAGHDFADFWARAKAARKAGHGMAAWTLYSLARVFVDRGPYWELPQAQAFEADIAGMGHHPLGPPYPKPLRLGAETYTLQNVRVGGGPEGVRLAITYEVEPGLSDAEKVKQNRRFIEAFMAAYPDWQEAADSVQARAHEPGAGQSYLTTYVKGRGYTAEAGRI